MVFGFSLLSRKSSAEEKESSAGGGSRRDTNDLQSERSRNDYYNEDDNENEHYDITETHRITSAEIAPCKAENEAILRRFGELRNENTFCDVNFLCKGVLFRGHRVIISSWSRWLRSLLVESPNEEVISLDIFSSEALGSILDYMYGVPLYIDVPRADNLLCVVRRLELLELEQQIWKFCMSAIDLDNCDLMHELADRYDCPALKLAAFKVLKQKDPAYAAPPDHRMNQDSRSDVARRQKKFYDNGLIGPSERNKTRFDDDDNNDDSNEAEEYEDELPSVLKYRRGSVRPGGYGEFENAYYQEDDGSESQATIYPQDLAIDAPASEVVEAWARRLRQVYQECIPEREGLEEREGEEVTGNALEHTISKVRDNTRFHYTPRQNLSSSGLNRSILSENSNSQPFMHYNNEGVNIPRGTNIIDWHKELKSFYLDLNMPDKLSTISDILRTWRGKEEQMVSSLILKYQKSISKQMMAHLKSLLVIAENRTESSFVNTAHDNDYERSSHYNDD